MLPRLIALSSIVATLALASGALSGWPAEKTADLWLGGDVNLGDGGRDQLRGIAGIVRGAAGIINLEGPVSERNQLRSGGLRLWNAPAALGELDQLNVRVAGIANNHSADSTAGIEQTAAQLRKRGILPAGGHAGSVTLEINGLRIAIAAYDLTEGLPANLPDDLGKARAKSDVLIATFHVTGPPSYLPRAELRRAVDIAVDSGAVVIVAHGTHALGPLERRGKAVIAWGLGNLAFACDCTQESDAIILRARVQMEKPVEAQAFPIQAGVNMKPAGASRDAKGIFDLIDAVGSGRLLERHGSFAAF